ncbi:ABC transporter permease [Candidatus Uabimicrobium amorphum]|uniref:ABC transporter permease n=1 Tax=Uabimicrobium amorphum TaxID=2596890 RepID=A0A5S9F550_UABAM|nr:glycine betaine ABC transporter substrate-binding protein [Candidatus Uabimicrobium amorphum]BBM86466.1 ABC transporter permease [Candidatus Uabimicrobium amorphum]
MQKYWICLLIFALLCGCKEPVKIGAKTFSEQLVLAEIMAQLLENENIAVKRVIPYGNTRDCIQGLTSGQLDIYTEYTGTGLMILGEPSLSDREKAFSRVKEQFANLGVAWQARLGFANNYVLVMRRDQSIAQKIETMTDLTNVQSLRIGCDEDFTKRPLDGLSAMLRRYGLKTAQTIVEDDKSILYRALLDGEVDIVIGYSTDGQIEAFNLKTLSDNLRFFPVYEAAPIVHNKTLKRYPGINNILGKLAGLIDEKTMRAMNKQVELEGVHYRDVASQFLRKNKLIPEEENKKTSIKNFPLRLKILTN